MKQIACLTVAVLGVVLLQSEFLPLAFAEEKPAIDIAKIDAGGRSAYFNQHPVRFGQWHLARCTLLRALPRGSSGSGLVIATRHDGVPPSVLGYPLRFGSLLGRHFRLVLRHQD